MKILALDPGGSTGYAQYDSERRSWLQGTLRGEHHIALMNLLMSDNWDVVIYERFLYQRRELDAGVSLVLDSVEYIGVIKLYHQSITAAHGMVEKSSDSGLHLVQFTVPELVMQAPSSMQLWDDRKLKAAGLYTTDSPHARDATRHLLYYLTAGPTEHQDRSFIAKTKRPD